MLTTPGSRYPGHWGACEQAANTHFSPPLSGYLRRHAVTADDAQRPRNLGEWYAIREAATEDDWYPDTRARRVCVSKPGATTNSQNRVSEKL